MKLLPVCVVACLCSSAALALDPEVERLQKAHAAAVQRAVAPVDAAYQKELQKLLDQYTKAGKLDAALDAKTALEQLTGKVAAGEIPKQGDLAALTEKVVKGRFLFYFAPPRAKVMTFGENGSIREGAAEQERSWKLDGNELLIFNNANQLAHALRYSRGSDSFKTSTRDAIYKSRGCYMENAPRDK